MNTISSSNLDQNRAPSFRFDQSSSEDRIRGTTIDDFEFTTIETDRVKSFACSSTETASDMDTSDPEWQEDIRSVKRVSQRPARYSSGRRRKERKKGRARERHIIQHDYHDHAFEAVDFDEYVLDHDTTCAIKKKGGVAIPFPLKLHELLEKADEENLNEIVSWAPHGRAFVVHDPKEFVSSLMHRFFRQTKLTSFQRQLNLYGFCRLTKGPDGGGYYHELFLRGRPYLTKRMVRTKIKGTGYKAASNPECEPDFYNMTPVGTALPRSQQSSPTTLERLKSVYASRLPASVVTPETENCSISFDDTQDIVCEAPHLGNLPHCTETTDVPNCHKPFLNPRSGQKVVRLGNQHFQYMESLHPPPLGSAVLAQPISLETATATATATATDDNGSVSISPTIFENTFTTEETFHDESDESSEQRIDPLSVFLAEIGTDFDDDINFGSIVNLEECSDEAQNIEVLEV